jgi:RNA polymerase sigma factor (sigma-70 family)
MDNGEFKIVSDDELNQAIANWKATKDSKYSDIVVKSNLGYIISVATKYRRNNDINDLINEGVIGLFGAMERFDPSLGIKFGSYAIHYIRGAVMKSCKRNLLVGVSAKTINDAWSLKRDAAWVAANVIIDNSRASNMLSMDDAVSFNELIADTPDYMNEESDIFYINDALSRLSESLKNTITTLYNIGGDSVMNASEASRVIGCSSWNVNLSVARAFPIMRVRIKSMMNPDENISRFRSKEAKDKIKRLSVGHSGNRSNKLKCAKEVS